ncbi:MAG: type II toxin-antitoxin system RelE/ParE family toxin [Candidatus Peribacteria bacterium]|nr:type II toxin-antitoxin system RelE/ParE family toxin [Candidatus Peribacteria bacterium]
MYEEKRIAKFPKNTEQGFRDAVDFFRKAKSLDDIYKKTSFHFEKYKRGKYKGLHSVRCDIQYRLIIDIETDPELILILEEVTDPH